MAFSPAAPLYSTPFDHIAETYDEVFTNSLIGRAQRKAVWQDLDRCFSAGQRILELNCGTGVDAVHVALRGVRVLACDAAPRMIDVARRRSTTLKVEGAVEFRVLATEQIAVLQNQAPFDGAFSNFAGLNCVEDLSAVARNLAGLLRPGSTALLCMAGHSVGWEIVWYLARGNARKAFRRFQRGGTVGRLAEGAIVRVYYPPVRATTRMFAPYFRLARCRGIGLAVPPSYLEPFAQRFPNVLNTLARIDRWLSGLPALRNLADHVLLQFQRTEERP